jgi:hypothetical protein
MRKYGEMLMLQFISGRFINQFLKLVLFTRK